MKMPGVLILGLGVAALFAAPALEAQCGCCGHHRAGWRGAGPGGGWGAGPQAQRMYDPATVTTLKGTVTAVAVEAPRPGRVGGVHITLQAEQKAAEVHIGPAWFAQTAGLAFTKGDPVEVTGSLVTQGEKTFLLAREVKKDGKEVKLRDAEGTPLWSRRPR